MKLYVARHGQSVANKLGVMSGAQDDTPLTEQGWKDAAQLAQKMMGFRGLFVASPLHRAQQTAAYVRDQIFPGAPIRIDEDFAERDMGSATDRPRDEYDLMETSGIPIAGAETPEAMFERISRGLRTIRQTGKDTLLVAHGETYRMIACVLQGLPPQEFTTIPLPQNGEVTLFDL